MSYFYKTLDYITHISADIFHLLQFFPSWKNGIKSSFDLVFLLQVNKLLRFP